jgi:hypothetical protein
VPVEACHLGRRRWEPLPLPPLDELSTEAQSQASDGGDVSGVIRR